MINVVFRDRTHAGRQLARALMEYRAAGAVVYAIPMGGVPVACEVARHLQASLDLVLPRKLPIPWNPEAGFGAMTDRENIVLNRQLVDSMKITKAQIEVVADMVEEEIARYTASLRDLVRQTDVTGKTAIIVDDGLASGYTMLAAVRHVRTLNPAKIVAAAPVASAQAAQLLESEADRTVTMETSGQIPFAVADFYIEWHDLTDEEAAECLRKS